MSFNGIILLVCFVASFAAFAVILRHLYLILRAARNENRFDLWFERIKSVLVYVALQARVLAQPAGLGHFVIFWGFIFITIGTLDHMLSQMVPGVDIDRFVGAAAGAALLFLQEIFGALVIGAIIVAAVRRFVLKPERLRIDDPQAPREAGFILSLIFILVVVMYGVRATEIAMGSERFLKANLPVSRAVASVFYGKSLNYEATNLVLSWIHNAIIFFFLLYIPFSKHIHIVGAIPNVFFRNLNPMGSLSRMDFEDESAEKFGVSELTDYTWKQLLDLYACTECGRCQIACPAFRTQKPLSPYRVIHRLRAQLMRERKSIFSCGGAVIVPGPIIPENVSEDEIWSCTTCGACMHECPTFIEHVQKLVDLRRYLVMTESRFPTELQAVFKNLETNANPWAIGHASRADWADGSQLPLASEKKRFDVLFWVGCAGSFDARAQKVTRAVVSLLKSAGVDFAVLGTEEKCCGETARRMGNEYLAQNLIESNIETLKKYDFKVLLTACPHGYNSFGVEYPRFGFSVPVVHHSQFLLDLVARNKLKPGKAMRIRGAYHDSCYLARYNGIISEPRELLESAFADLREFERRGFSGFCCGAGGGRMWMEEHLGARINEERTRELVSLGVEKVFTACPFCLTMFQDGLKSLGRNDIEALDIAEFLNSSCSNG